MVFESQRQPNGFGFNVFSQPDSQKDFGFGKSDSQKDFGFGKSDSQSGFGFGKLDSQTVNAFSQHDSQKGFGFGKSDSQTGFSFGRPTQQRQRRRETKTKESFDFGFDNKSQFTWGQPKTDPFQQPASVKPADTINGNAFGSAASFAFPGTFQAPNNANQFQTKPLAQETSFGFQIQSLNADPFGVKSFSTTTSPFQVQPLGSGFNASNAFSQPDSKSEFGFGKSESQTLNAFSQPDSQKDFGFGKSDSQTGFAFQSQSSFNPTATAFSFGKSESQILNAFSQPDSQKDFGFGKSDSQTGFAFPSTTTFSFGKSESQTLNAFSQPDSQKDFGFGKSDSQTGFAFQSQSSFNPTATAFSFQPESTSNSFQTIQQTDAFQTQTQPVMGTTATFPSFETTTSFHTDPAPSFHFDDPTSNPLTTGFEDQVETQLEDNQFFDPDQPTAGMIPEEADQPLAQTTTYLPPPTYYFPKHFPRAARRQTQGFDAVLSDPVRDGPVLVSRRDCILTLDLSQLPNEVVVVVEEETTGESGNHSSGTASFPEDWDVTTADGAFPGCPCFPITVEELSIACRGNKVVWPGRVTVASFEELASAVRFNKDDVDLLPNDATRPPVGSGLNGTMVVTMCGVGRGKEPGKVERKLVRHCEKSGTRFVSFQDGNWTFEVSGV